MTLFSERRVCLSVEASHRSEENVPSSTYSMEDSEVPGLSTTPEAQPRSLICAEGGDGSVRAQRAAPGRYAWAGVGGCRRRKGQASWVWGQ
jgi:hypothetical protein